MANDSAAAVAAGGIVLREERRISMQKERLSIAPSRIVVEYEFINDSANDITTEVAFPVPEYGYRFDGLEGPIDLGGFKASVDGVEIPVAKQVRALARGEDHAPLLRDLGIDAERHGNFDPTDWSAPGHPNQIRGLPAAAFDRLVSLGLIEAADPAPGWPRWKIAKTPIYEFELLVERPEGTLVSFCWDGKVEKVTKTQFRAAAKDFVPTKELAVFFLHAT